MAETIVTAQNPWAIGLQGDSDGFNSADDFSSPGEYNYAASLWSDVSGKRKVISNIAQSSNLALMFFGTDAEDEVGQIRLWGYSFADQGGTKFTATFLAQLTITLGARDEGSGTVFGDNIRFAKLITPTRDRTLFPGIRIVGEEPDDPAADPRKDSAALLLLDALGFKGYIVEGRKIVPASAPGASALATLGFAYRLL
ncbi:MAG: hypothetical protein ACF8R7_16760 [Phycisphaerales bacterium JB039]